MTATSKPIVFFGSGPVAAHSLDFLRDYFEIEAVITKPRPPHHHATFPVIDIISQHNFQAYYPENKLGLATLFSKEHFKSQLGVIVDYGLIVTQDVIQRFPLGIINSHFSLLPEWRGADPITFAILSGQQKTGVSLMRINPKLDEGDILHQVSVSIAPDATAAQLTTQLTEISNKLLRQYLPRYIDGKVIPRPQDLKKPITYSRRLTKEDGRLDWRKPAIELEREIRAYQEWPKSYTTLANKDVIVTKARVLDRRLPRGALVIENHSLFVGCKEGVLEILELKPSGKSVMSARAFVAGYVKP